MNRNEDKNSSLDLEAWKPLVVRILVISVIALATSGIDYVKSKNTTTVDFWFLLGVGGAIILLLSIFVFLLRREPSRVLQFRQRLVSAYTEPLAESLKGRDIVSKA